jgi:hypothetical protein
MIIAMLFLLSFAGTIEGMRRGRHTLGLSYCGRGWQFICWMATRFVVVNWDNHNNGVLKKRVRYSTKVQVGGASWGVRCMGFICLYA